MYAAYGSYQGYGFGHTFDSWLLEYNMRKGNISYTDRIYTIENLKMAWNIRNQQGGVNYNESLKTFKAYLRELKIDEILND